MAERIHGSNSTYQNHGCRCEPCVEAHRIAHNKMIERLRARVARGEIEIPHGTQNGYGNYGCRCAACRGAHADNRARYNRRRKGKQ